MAKEINLFDTEIETVEPQHQNESLLNELLTTAEPSELQKALPQSRLEQPTLPGISEDIQQTQRAGQQDRFMRQHAKRIIESLLFASTEPLTFNKIREIVDTFHPLKPSQLRNLIVELQQDYLSQQRSFRLEEIAQGYMLRTCEEYSPFIDALFHNKRTEKLSQASVEVLAIIAYKNPITRPQIEAIRGVDSSGIIQNLLERELIEPVGKLDAPGRPTLFGITKNFLRHYGLRDVEDLPSIPNGPQVL